MDKTKDDIRADMTTYLQAAKEAMNTSDILQGDSRRGVKIVNLACSFKQSDVLEEAVAKEVKIEQGHMKEDQQVREKEEATAKERRATSEY